MEEPPWALVTGAATGIGRATARCLARDGLRLILHSRRHRKEAEELARELSTDAPGTWVVSGDLAREEEVHRMGAEIRARVPSLSVAVHNAGEYPRRPVDELTPEAFRATLETNLVSAFALTKEILPLLRANPTPARLVFISSVLAYNGSSHGADYAASKAGILGLARSLARELAPSITVNVVAPGSIDTAILEHDPPSRRRERERAIPLGRIGTPEEVGEAVAFLASPRASYLTGVTLHVNGGLRMD